ncbi:MAG: aconitate hydratase [Oligoflexia bacterium]|nr:aconitate hydratase [Oligoflexia bacterium]
MEKNLAVVSKRLNRPLTLAEKIVFGHLDDPEKQELKAGSAFLLLRPDRVAMQDATAQMALLQFMSAGVKTTAVPSTVHCDHLLLGRFGAQKDLENALSTNKEVYDFLESVSNKFGIGFWKPGSGIIHQVVLENYAFPGGMMIGTDSHTPNAGGLGMVAVGVGGGDAVDVMAGFAWEVKQPKLIGVHLKGKMNGWTSPKDVILKVLGMLTVKGGTNKIVEYFGEGSKSISCTGKGTITNMGAELGATTSLFPYDESMSRYLRATSRADLADLADKHMHLVTADKEVLADPKKFYDEYIEIDLSTLEPHVVGPHTPDLARPISALKKEVQEKGYSPNLTAALIGSCTNSSYEDISRAADVAKQAIAKGVKSKSELFISPGSEQVFETVKRDGLLSTLEQAGGVILTNSCGPCIGQWKRDNVAPGTVNSIITSFNRNFKGRNDGNAETQSFISSPEIVVAMGLSGRLDFDPIHDTLEDSSGKTFKLAEPKPAPDIPPSGFIPKRDGYVNPKEDGSSVVVKIAPTSERLQELKPFAAWDEKDFVNFPLLLKAKGKCTTDHISPAGPWLKFRGHLDNISNNMFLGAVNSFSGDIGKVKNMFTGQVAETPKIAREYKAEGKRWIVVGDENYGEGSSREHAAMSPRFLGAAAVIVRSFARIHETNLKKQGVLPLTFANPADYDKVQEADEISILGLTAIAPGSDLKCVLKHKDGKTDEFLLKHTLNNEQIRWFKAGSALNVLKQG